MAKEKLCHNGSWNGGGFWYYYVKTSRDKWSFAINVSLILRAARCRIKGIEQRILKGVNTKLKYSVLVNWRPSHFILFYFFLNGHHHKMSIKPFSATQRLIRWLCLVKVMLQCYVQKSAILSVTLTLTLHSLSIPESQISQTWWHKAILWSKSDSGLLYSEIDGKSFYIDWKMPESQFD